MGARPKLRRPLNPRLVPGSNITTSPTEPSSRNEWLEIAGAGHSRDDLQRLLDEAIAGGGEGLMLHRVDAADVPGRSHALLKMKPLHDAEARVVGHVAGRGKYEGRLGARPVRTDEDIEFLIGTGLSDVEREDPSPLGAVVTFTFRGTTVTGLPRFASYLRLHTP